MTAADKFTQMEPDFRLGFDEHIKPTAIIKPFVFVLIEGRTFFTVKMQ